MTAATHLGFLADILREPDADDLRLIYADWLQDHGDPERAEFIRVQCEIARALADNKLVTPGGPEDVWLRAAKKKERRLLARLRPAFAASLPAYQTLHWCIYRLDTDDGTAEEFTAAVSRGFISLMTVSCAAWRGHGPALVASHPVEAVRLVDVAVVISHGEGKYGTQHPGIAWPWNRKEYGAIHDGHGFAADTEQGVEAALSRACLLWARAEARKRKLGVWAE